MPAICSQRLTSTADYREFADMMQTVRRHFRPMIPRHSGSQPAKTPEESETVACDSPVVRRADLRREICISPAACRASVRGDRGDDAGARHRRQQRDLRVGRRDAAAAAALRQPGSAGHDLEDIRRDLEKFRLPAEHAHWNCRSRTFAKIAGFTPNVGGMVMAGRDGNAETVSRQWVTAGIFDVLGVKTIAGRTFLPEDEEKPLRHRDERVVVGVALQSRSRHRRSGNQD